MLPTGLTDRRIASVISAAVTAVGFAASRLAGSANIFGYKSRALHARTKRSAAVRLILFQRSIVVVVKGTSHTRKAHEAKTKPHSPVRVTLEPKLVREFRASAKSLM